ncbi:redox-sensing transcriptional repressor Rex [Clostridium sp. DL1XJH146]
MNKKEKKSNVSMAVIRRLPKYHRYLQELIKNDIDRISSRELSQKIGFTASQIRQDLNCFGDFGQQGYGYNVSDLYREISIILGLDFQYKTVIVGAGNIGQAIANYTEFNRLGFELKGIFDVNPKLIGLKIRDVEVKDIDSLNDFLSNCEVDIAVICVPGENAQKVCEIVVKNGVSGIWNFAPVDIETPENVTVENVHLSESLLTLTYLLKQKI